MNIKTTLRCVQLLLLALSLSVLLALTANPAHAYLVGPPYSLEKLSAEADVVFKATAIESQPVEDAWFAPLNGFRAFGTRFKIVSLLKGELPPGEVLFRHHGPSENAKFMMYSPQQYKFTPGRSYLVWADKTEDGALRQLPKSHTWLADQGGLLAADDAPTQGDLKSVVWSEFTALLQSRDAEDVRYAIEHLHMMSGGEWPSAPEKDFERTRVVAAVKRFLFSPDVETALAAIRAVQPDAKDVEAELTSVVRTHAHAQARAGALLALRGVKTPAVEMAARRALEEMVPTVQRAALIRLSDFPGEATRAQWRAFAKSPHETARVGVAEAIGMVKDGTMVSVLDALLDDGAKPVHEAAVRSLLLMPHAQASKIWQKRRAQPVWMPVFTNALAATNAAPYLSDLARIVRKQLHPDGNLSPTGTNPVYTSWHLLFDHLQKQTPTALESPALRPFLDALESNYTNWSSSEPEQLYKLYRAKGLEARARDFRRRAQAAVSYDLGIYFKRADENIARERAQKPAP